MNALAVDSVTGVRTVFKRVRGGSGLGDSIYLRPIVDYLVENGERVTVLSFFPDVFIGSGATVEPFNKTQIDVLAHYSLDRKNQTTNQWQDVLKCAGVAADIPLRFTWNIRNRRLVDDLKAKAGGRKIIVVHGGRTPFGRSDGMGMEILPERAAFAVTLAAMKGCFLVRVGQGNQLYPLAVDVDLNDKTSVSDLLDIAAVCDGVVTQCGFPVPLAECFDKPVLVVWSARGLVSVQPIIALITPAKILCKPTSRYVMDDWDAESIRAAARTFCQPEVVAA